MRHEQDHISSVNCLSGWWSLPWRCWPGYGRRHKYVPRNSIRAGCSWVTRGAIQASINGVLVAPHGHKLCVAFISFRRACTSQARGRETLLDTLAWPVACNPPYGQPFTMENPNPSKLLERRWNLFHKQRPAVDSTPDACCWSSPRIRTEPPHSRTEVNGTVVRSYGGQSGRLKAGWSQNMQRCFHHLQRSMRRRLGSSLVPCPGAWAGCWHRCGHDIPLPHPSPSC